MCENEEKSMTMGVIVFRDCDGDGDEQDEVTQGHKLVKL